MPVGGSYLGVKYQNIEIRTSCTSLQARTHLLSTKQCFYLRPFHTHSLFVSFLSSSPFSPSIAQLEYGSHSRPSSRRPCSFAWDSWDSSLGSSCGVASRRQVQSSEQYAHHDTSWLYQACISALPRKVPTSVYPVQEELQNSGAMPRP